MEPLQIFILVILAFLHFIMKRAGKSSESPPPTPPRPDRSPPSPAPPPAPAAAPENQSMEELVEALFGQSKSPSAPAPAPFTPPPTPARSQRPPPIPSRQARQQKTAERRPQPTPKPARAVATKEEKPSADSAETPNFDLVEQAGKPIFQTHIESRIPRQTQQTIPTTSVTTTKAITNTVRTRLRQQQEIRTAIILNEILQPPVALR